MTHQNEKEKVEIVNTSKSEDRTPNPKDLASEANSNMQEGEVSEKQSLIERWKNSRFRLVRAMYILVVSIWTVVMVIGGFIVWLISFLFI